jgi:hypothetical protein
MSIDRTLILKGPCKLTHNAATFFSQGDVQVDFITDTFAVETSAFGPLDTRVQARRIEVTLSPSMWNDLTKLFPYASALIGSTIFGATDLPLVITPSHGAPLTLPNAAVSQLPSITLSHGKPLLGALKFTALCANNADPATQANWFAFGTPASGVALTGFDLTKVYNSRYSLAFNAVTYASEEGFNLDFALGLAPDVVDGEGIVNYRVTSLDASLKFVPTGNTEAAFATLLQWTKAPGAAPTAYGAVISGETTGAPIVTLASMQVKGNASARYGASVGRFGEIELVSKRTLTAGALNPLWAFTAAA